MKYISRSDIVGLLLDAANGGGATKTKLMYKAYHFVFKSQTVVWRLSIR
jgi:hypothetical protein